MNDTVLSVSDFVALTNQTLSLALPNVVVEGEVSSFQVSKGKWVYMDLKDANSKVRIFGSVYQLNVAVEDGMLVKIRGVPRLHNLYGFSLNMQSIQLSGEGSLRKSFELMQKKLTAEGIFDEDRKRPLPKYPQRIGVISSEQAAGYSDFIKILNNRWSGIELIMADVQVQGEVSPGQIIRALEYMNSKEDLDVIVLVRGGGSLEDLQSFNSENVVRAIASSRTPTLVGVGHEVDITLAGMAADLRASTPSNAAQLVVPDKDELDNRLTSLQGYFSSEIRHLLGRSNTDIKQKLDILVQSLLAPVGHVSEQAAQLQRAMSIQLKSKEESTLSKEKTLSLLDPRLALKRGYSLVRKEGKLIRSSAELNVDDIVVLEFGENKADAVIRKI